MKLFYCLGFMWLFCGIVQGSPNDEVLKSLAEYYKDDRTVEQIKKDNVLIAAAGRGDVEKVRQALVNGALVNSRYLDDTAFLDAGGSNYTALMRASRAGHDEVVKLLIAAKADLDLERDGKSSLYMALMAKKESIVELLVKAGAKDDPKQIRLTHDLMRAACRGFKMQPNDPSPPYPGCIGNPDEAPEIVDVLGRGANVNSRHPNGYTALMYAANLGLVDNVKLLLEKGADASLMSNDNQTALSLVAPSKLAAVTSGRRQVFELLQSRQTEIRRD